MEENSAGHVPMEGTTVLKTQLLVNDMVIPLNEFTQMYIGNILKGIALSLGHSAKKVSINVDPEGLNIYSGDTEVPVKKDFTHSIIESTIKGMLSPLKGVFWLEKVTITTTE